MLRLYILRWNTLQVLPLRTSNLDAQNVHLLLTRRVNFGLYPGCYCECYLVDTLDSIILLQRVLILCCALSNLVWLKLRSLSFGQLLKYRLSSLTFS